MLRIIVLVMMKRRPVGTGGPNRCGGGDERAVNVSSIAHDRRGELRARALIDILIWIVAVALFLGSGVRWLLLPLGVSWPAWLGFFLGASLGASLTAGNLPLLLALGFALAAVAHFANGYRLAEKYGVTASIDAPPMQESQRTVLIVVANWPSGTMAIKFGQAMKEALSVTDDHIQLVQMGPERIFKAVTNVTEPEFRALLAASGVSVPEQINFVELGPNIL